MTRPDAIRARERRVVIGGAVVTLVAVLVTYGVMPFVRHWQTREAALDAARDRVAYFESLLGRTTTLEAEAAAAEGQLAGETRRVLHARSATLAASATQSYLQDMADASSLVVSRLEVSADDTLAVDSITGVSASDANSLRIPAMMSVYGDITGAAAFLRLAGNGPRILLVDRLVLQRNAALAGAPDVVQMTMTLRVPVLPE